jgi:hypothetical protein
MASNPTQLELDFTAPAKPDDRFSIPAFPRPTAEERREVVHVVTTPMIDGTKD